MSGPKKFVENFLTKKNDYILEAHPNSEAFHEDEFFQFSYKVEKSKAVENLENHQNGLVEIPRWAVYVACIATLFFLGFLGGALYNLANLRPDSIYGEDCSKWPCSKALNLKCINKTCQCEAPKLYKGKCFDLAKYNEPCVFTTDCDPKQVLSCIGYSTCGCAPTLFWNSAQSKCIDRRTYGEFCNGDQCKININLGCVSGVCNCIDSNLYYWNGYACLPKKNYNQSCFSQEQCKNSELTYCDGSSCICTSTQYFDTSLSKCVTRLFEFQTCKFTDMCYSPMFCSVFSQCKCLVTQFFNQTIFDCVNKHLNGESCASNNQCRTDLGLTCQSGICLCSSPTHTWYPAGTECKLTFSQTTCTNNLDCNPAENLVCNAGYNCTCSLIHFWNASKSACVDRLTHGDTCVGDQCKLNINITCNAAIGKCDCLDNSLLFWNGIACIPKKNYNQLCTNSIQCLDSELTYCDGTKCVCPAVEYFEPSVSHCVPKLGENVTCPFNDACLSPMICRSSSPSYCACTLTTQYFNSTISNCVNKKTYYQECITNNHCRYDYGLFCNNSLCLCSSGYSWYSTGSVCKLTYSSSTCAADSDCNPSEKLVCSSTCNCPNPSGTGKCDCLRNSGNENYWNGTECVPAKAYGLSCTKSYECKTLTEGTSCNTTTQKCDCYIPGGFSTKDGICKMCGNREVFFNDVCYYISNYVQNKRDDARDECKNVIKVNGSKSELAIINSVALNNFISTQLEANTKYWISGKDEGKATYGYNWEESSKDEVLKDVCDFTRGSKKCLNYSSADKCFYNDYDCGSPLKFICQRAV